MFDESALLFPPRPNYASTRDDALAKVEALALRVPADRLEPGEPVLDLGGLFIAA